MDITKRYKSNCTAIWLFVCFIPLGALAAPPDFPASIDTNPQSVVEYRVVGITDTATDGSAAVTDDQGVAYRGIVAMNRLCREEVHPQSRLARVREYYDTPGARLLLTTDTGPAWVAPGEFQVVFRPDPFIPDDDWAAVSTYYGAAFHSTAQRDPEQAVSRASCDQWLAAGPEFSALYIQADSGRASEDDCDKSYRLLCAAPVVVPAGP
jgi:hypothetical protein